MAQPLVGKIFFHLFCIRMKIAPITSFNISFGSIPRKPKPKVKEVHWVMTKDELEKHQAEIKERREKAAQREEIWAILKQDGSRRGFVDEPSQAAVRKEIKWHINENKFGGWLDEEEFKELMNYLYGKKKVVIPIPEKTKPKEAKTKAFSDKDAMKLDITNLGCFSTKTHCYRGKTLNADHMSLMRLKKAGIERIIDLEGYSSYAKLCEENGLEYYQFFKDEDKVLFDSAVFYPDLESYLEAFPHKKYEDKYIETGYDEKNYQEEKEQFIEDLIGFTEAVNKDYAYVGCECGTTKTNIALFLNIFFNPQATKKGHQPPNFNPEKYANKLKGLYSNLSDDHKKRLGFTEETESMWQDVMAD